MKPALVPSTTRTPHVPAPSAFGEPTALFRRRAWNAFEKSLDPLGTPRPLRPAPPHVG